MAEMKTAMMKLTIGPLRYLLRAEDARGGRELEILRNNVVPKSFKGRADRIIHFVGLRLSKRIVRDIHGSRLPERLLATGRTPLPRSGWRLTGSETGPVLWLHPRSRHAFWTLGTIGAGRRSKFQVPWQAFLEDIVRLGGGVIHSGLFRFEGKGYLFLGPPGAGKTTAASRLSAAWEILADDACLIWPEGRASWRASPLPTWSVILGINRRLPAIRSWDLAGSVSLSGAIFLEKNEPLTVRRVEAIEAAKRIFLGLIEHPRIFQRSDPHKKRLFRAACRFARAVPAFELRSKLIDPIESVLVETLKNG
jgi:hypothetical protein